MTEYRERARRVVYENPWLRFEAHEIVHPSGAEGEHGVVIAPESAAVVALDDEDLVLARQPRYAVGREQLEVCKGGAEPGETPLACAQREAREELGLVAAEWTRLGRLYEIPSIVRNGVDVFLATGCRFEERASSAIESIELVRVPVGQAVALALKGGIDDAITVAAILRAAASVGRLTTR